MGISFYKFTQIKIVFAKQLAVADILYIWVLLTQVAKVIVEAFYPESIC
jgi:hypothetical protein